MHLNSSLLKILFQKIIILIVLISVDMLSNLNILEKGSVTSKRKLTGEITSMLTVHT